VCASGWDAAPLERVLTEAAQRLVGGRDAVLVVDDTPLPKQGHHSVGVAHQYSGMLGKNTNCQALVSLTLARGEVPVPVALRLFLPQAWTADPARCRRAGVPAARRAARTKGEIALQELDRVRASGAAFGVVLADAGYGCSAAFRRALSARALTWAVGIPRLQKVYPPDVQVRPARVPPTGRPPKHPVPTAPRATAEAVLAARPEAWHTVTWRRGTKGPLAAGFAAMRVCVADGPELARGQHLPGEVLWLVGERRATGERKYYLTNHPAGTALPTLVAAIKARWVCEQAHQQLKVELGLDHFQGRSWAGLHHHALLTLIAFAFLQHLRLREAARGGSGAPVGPPPHPTLPAIRRALAVHVAPIRSCPRCAELGRTRSRHRAPPEVAK
jgi:SRSO17 transposase